MLLVEHSIVLVAFCIQNAHNSFPQKSIPIELLNGLSIYPVKALENVKNVLENTLEKSLNFSFAKVWEPCNEPVLLGLDKLITGSSKIKLEIACP